MKIKYVWYKIKTEIRAKKTTLIPNYPKRISLYHFDQNEEVLVAGALTVWLASKNIILWIPDKPNLLTQFETSPEK